MHAGCSHELLHKNRGKSDTILKSLPAHTQVVFLRWKLLSTARPAHWPLYQAQASEPSRKLKRKELPKASLCLLDRELTNLAYPE